MPYASRPRLLQAWTDHIALGNVWAGLYSTADKVRHQQLAVSWKADPNSNSGRIDASGKMLHNDSTTWILLHVPVMTGPKCFLEPIQLMLT